YTAEDDVALGSTIANRTEGEVEGLIGFFVNTLVLRCSLAGDLKVGELLGRAREVSLAAYAHQDLPFEKLVEELQPERSLDRNPLVTVLLNLQNAPLDLDLPGTGLAARPFELSTGTAKLDLELFLWERPEGLSVAFEYSTDLFDA